MRGFLGRRYAEVHTKHVDDGLRASESTSGIGAFAKVFRMVLQSGILGLGAYLVIQGEMSGGSMIAASIMMSRALAPIEIAVAQLEGLHRRPARAIVASSTSCRSSRRRSSACRLPAPKQRLVRRGHLCRAPPAPQADRPGASLQLQAGQGLGLIGPSASGKSTLARALVGVWPTLRGEIRLDGAALDQWEPDDLGRHIGYLPQDVELFDGTVAENIARFQPERSPRPSSRLPGRPARTS